MQKEIRQQVEIRKETRKRKVEKLIFLFYVLFWKKI